MRIAFIGTRGIPANHGGFETMVEELSIRLIKKHKVFVSGDISNKYENKLYKNIIVYNSPYSKPNNPFFYYMDSLIKANNWGADFIIMCGVGGSMCIPFFYKIRDKIFIHPDGLGFKRAKYNKLKKLIFFTQYMLSSFLSKNIICDAVGIQDFYVNELKKNQNNTFVIEHGAYLNRYIKSNPLHLINNFFKNNYKIDLKSKSYYLIVARIEPENNIEMIINGYNKSKREFPLIIVGNKNTKHFKEINRLSSEVVLFVGGIYDKDNLSLVRYNAIAYFHGHSVGGTNPSLIEAMASKNLCICHDNKFNREMLSGNGLFFNNSDDISNHFDLLESNHDFNFLVDKSFDKAKKYYTWENMVNKYVSIFK